MFPYIHGIELLQSCDSTTAKHVQCRCNTKTVSLQSIYSFIARHVQQYCKVCTATLQHRYNTISEKLKRISLECGCLVSKQKYFPKT